MTVLDGVVADVLLPLGCREQRVWFKRPRLKLLAANLRIPVYAMPLPQASTLG
jgi:hypothetical protein